MLILKALKHQKVYTLWIGQVLSTMGDEVYRVAFIWLSVQLIGTNAGYLSSLQILCAVLANLFAVKLVRNYTSEKAMIRLDFLRAIIVLIPVVMFYGHVQSFAILAASSLLLSGLGALFEPVLLETIPKVASEPELLRAANGLMSTTFRLARVLGPAVVGLLSGLIPMIHFFSIDACSFMASAYAVKRLKLSESGVKDDSSLHEHKGGLLGDFARSWRLLKTKPDVLRALFAKSFTGGAWNLSYVVGFALLAQEVSPGDATFFGQMMCAYGIGNVTAALVLGNLKRTSSERMVYQGLIYLGIMFCVIPFCHSHALIFGFVALSAVGGPWNDLPFIDLVQSHFKNRELSQIYRMRSICENASAFLFMVMSPLLFRLLSVRQTIFGSGVLLLFSGIIAMLAKKRSDSSL